MLETVMCSQGLHLTMCRETNCVCDHFLLCLNPFGHCHLNQSCSPSRFFQVCFPFHNAVLIHLKSCLLPILSCVLYRQYAFVRRCTLACVHACVYALRTVATDKTALYKHKFDEEKHLPF